jgi:hypothetical protein
MLKANNSPSFERAFAIYNRHLLKRRFNSFRISDINFLKNTDVNVPQIVYANHSSWWDGLIFLEILRRFDNENFVLMEKSSCENYFSFACSERFQVVREKPREAIESINYACKTFVGKFQPHTADFSAGRNSSERCSTAALLSGLGANNRKSSSVPTRSGGAAFGIFGKFQAGNLPENRRPKTHEFDKTFDRKARPKNYERRLTETLDSLKQDVTAQKFESYDKIF